MRNKETKRKNQETRVGKIRKRDIKYDGKQQEEGVKMAEIKDGKAAKKKMSMTGTKGYLLKIMAMSGAMDLEGIRIFYGAYKGNRTKDKHMKILRDNGYIQKSMTNRKSYYHLTQKGKDMVLAGGIKNTLDCSEYLTGHVVTNQMPLVWRDEKDKVQRCIYQGRILAEMYQGRVPVFWTDKEDLFKNEKKVREMLEQRIEAVGGRRDPELKNMAECICGIKRSELGLREDMWENHTYDKRYGLYLYGREKKSVTTYYPSMEIKNKKNPALKQSRALGCMIVRGNAPYAVYYIEDKLIRWRPKAEADMRKWIGGASEKLYKGRYQGDTEYVRGLFIVKSYDVVLRMITEEEKSKVRRNITLDNRVYVQNHYTTLNDLRFYYDPEFSLKIINEIIKRYGLRENRGRYMHNGMMAWFGFRVSSRDIEQMRSGYVFCLRSQAKLYEELGMYPMEIDEISEEIKNLSKK